MGDEETFHSSRLPERRPWPISEGASAQVVRHATESPVLNEHGFTTRRVTNGNACGTDRRVL